MQGAEHAAGQEHDRGEQHRGGRTGRAQQAEAREQERNCRRGEHFEEAFHPQVHHPPAPVLDHGEVRVFAPHEARAIKQPDAHGGGEQQCDDGFGFSARLHGGPQRATHQRQPDPQSREQEDLPETAEVHIFPALVTEPEITGETQLLHHGQPLAGEGADHDDQQAGEQHVDAEPLEFRLVP